MLKALGSKTIEYLKKLESIQQQKHLLQKKYLHKDQIQSDICAPTLKMSSPFWLFTATESKVHSYQGWFK